MPFASNTTVTIICDEGAVTEVNGRGFQLMRLPCSNNCGEVLLYDGVEHGLMHVEVRPLAWCSLLYPLLCAFDVSPLPTCPYVACAAASEGDRLHLCVPSHLHTLLLGVSLSSPTPCPVLV